MSEPQYYVEDPIEQKVNDGHNEPYPQVTNINEIQPILTVSQIVSSMKQSFEDLSEALRPFTWSRAVQVHNQQNQVDQKEDLHV